MKPTFFRSSRSIAVSAIAAAALAACGGGGGDDSPAQAPIATAATGTVAVAAMTGAPSCAFDQVNVSIARIRFHKDFQATAASSGWSEVAFAVGAKKLNLLNAAGVLSGATTSLGDVTLPAGIYTQMRLVIETPVAATPSPNTVRVKGQSTIAGPGAPGSLETPASLASEGVKMPIDLTIEEGKQASVVFDFDACNSIQPRGDKYLLRPVARVVPAALNGVSGYIDKAALASDVVITAQQGGISAITTVPNPTTGEFLLPRLPAGNYDVVITGKGRATSVIGQVPVAANTTVAVSTVAAPIVLPTSTTSTISGQIGYAAGKAAPESGTWVAASQSIAANASTGIPASTFAHRFQPVDQATGNYTLTDLPRASLRYALYKPALPLTLANITTVPAAGRYKVEAVATGYSRVTTFGTNSSGVPTATATADVNASTGNVANVNIIFY
ncbi:MULTISPECIES: DUF4382 domain-containing protein [unclassified Massilia]|uniref:DUF4382 domain-containing protein n=1 Tax=unclassified Massilia TaxID=2609279 RepID=UPI0017818974|nr:MULTISPECIES: DUF4382 domain-containing protein [unclassified Massilia]MBD8531075.1 DUF4382 domain-containing protein [Massilia sp. CFBP 13647]MBD8674775.1 DUF4382 domain-containing protein [Massilia sp. CFBP 13721]